MKKTLMIAIGLLALAAVIPVYGQMNGLRVDIPFAFRAGNETLPAGAYRIAIDPLAKRMEFRAEDGTGAFLTAHLSDPDKTVETGVVIFHRYGDNYFLRRVTGAGQAVSYELPKSGAERELAKTHSNVHVASIRAK